MDYDEGMTYNGEWRDGQWQKRSLFQMAIPLKESLCAINGMDRASMSGQRVESMRGEFHNDQKQERGIFRIMDISHFWMSDTTMEDGRTATMTNMESVIGLMDVFIKVNGIRV